MKEWTWTPSKSSLKTKETEERKIFTMHAFSRQKMLKRQSFSVTKSRESSMQPEPERKNSLVRKTNMIERLLRHKLLLKNVTNKLMN